MAAPAVEPVGAPPPFDPSSPWNVNDLGRVLQQKFPQLAGRDPTELGTAAVAKYPALAQKFGRPVAVQPGPAASPPTSLVGGRMGSVAAEAVANTMPTTAGLPTIKGVSKKVGDAIKSASAIRDMLRSEGFRMPSPAPAPAESDDTAPSPLAALQPRTGAERVVAGLASGVSTGGQMLGLTAAGAPEAAALVAPALWQQGGVRERLGRAVAMLVGGKATEAASEGIEAGAAAMKGTGGALAKAAPVVSGAGKVLVPAVAFGSAVPYVDVATRRALGLDNVPWPKPGESIPDVTALAILGALGHAVAPAEPEPTGNIGAITPERAQETSRLKIQPPPAAASPATPKAVQAPAAAPNPLMGYLRLRQPGVAEELVDHYSLGHDLHPVAADARTRALAELRGPAGGKSILTSGELRDLARSSKDGATFRTRLQGIIAGRAPEAVPELAAPAGQEPKGGGEPAAKTQPTAAPAPGPAVPAEGEARSVVVAAKPEAGSQLEIPSAPPEPEGAARGGAPAVPEPGGPGGLRTLTAQGFADEKLAREQADALEKRNPDAVGPARVVQDGKTWRAEIDLPERRATPRAPSKESAAAPATSRGEGADLTSPQIEKYGNALSGVHGRMEEKHRAGFEARIKALADNEQAKPGDRASAARALELIEARKKEQTGELTESGTRGYQRGQSLSVPYSGRSKKITSERGILEGYTRVNGEPHVLVRVRRGKSTEVHTFPESDVRARRTIDRRPADVRKPGVAAKLRKEMTDRDRADEILAALMRERDDTEEKAKALVPQQGKEATPEYTAARARLRRLEDAVSIAGRIHREISQQGDAAEPEAAGAEVTFPRSASGGAPAARPAGPGKTGRLGEIPKVPEISAAEVAKLPGISAPSLTAKGSVAGDKFDAFKGALREWVEKFNPIALTDQRALDTLMRGKGDVERAMWRVDKTGKAIRRVWEKMSDAQLNDFLEREENGKPHASPAMQAISDAYREALDNGHAELDKYKAVNYRDNFFPHWWQNPEKAVSFFSGRKLGGSGRWSKARVFGDIRAGLDAGLKPMSRNPQDWIERYVNDVALFKAMQDSLGTRPRLTPAQGWTAPDGSWIGMAQARFGRVGARAGDGVIPPDFVVPEGRWATVFFPPEIDVKEFVDPIVHGKLQSVLSAIGGSYEREFGIGGTRAGYSSAAPGDAGRVVAARGTPMSVLAHELGHAIDSKYGLRQGLMSSVIRSPEMRALADLRHEGSTPTKSQLRYERSGPEKMAVMLEALIHTPDRFKQVAPNVYKVFTQFLASKPELKPLLDVRPSLVLEAQSGKVSAGGAVIGGSYWFQKDLARVLDNYMSKNWLLQSSWGRGAMVARNALIGLRLGLSGFHAVNLSLVAAMHSLATGISEAALGARRGEAGTAGRGLARMASSVFAGPRLAHTGFRLLADDPALAKYVEPYFTGGGRLRAKNQDASDSIHWLISNARRAASNDQPLQRMLAAAKAGASLPLAAVEAPIRLITKYYTEPLKLGAFMEEYAHEMDRRSDDLVSGKVTKEQIARRVHRDVEDRFGAVNYDNDFWNHGLRTSMQLLMTAPGWTLGNLRQSAGALMIDTPRAAAAPFRGEAPNITNRMVFSYLSLPFVTLAANGIYHWAHTGAPPKTLEDWLHPKNARGERVDLPSIARDVINWRTRPVKTLENKVSPFVQLIEAAVSGEAHGSKIVKMGHQGTAALKDWMNYLYRDFQPLTVQNLKDLTGAPSESKVEALLGVTKHYDTNAAPRGRYARGPRGPRFKP